jgi:hypothetical protein
MKRERTPFVKRHHLSLGADYALRLVRLFTDVFDGDLVLAMVFVAAAQANTQHLRRRADYVDHMDGPLFPDELRRAVSVSSLAHSLGLPVETARRYVIKLCGRGFAVRSEAGGVLVTTEILNRQEIRAAAWANATNMEILIGELQRTPRDR